MFAGARIYIAWPIFNIYALYWSGGMDGLLPPSVATVLPILPTTVWIFSMYLLWMDTADTLGGRRHFYGKFVEKRE